MFKLTFTCGSDPLSHAFPNGRGSSTCLWYAVSGKMSDKNLEQRTDFMSCVNIAKSVSEILAPLTMDYGEYAMKKYNSKEGKKMCKMT
jgi:hypothetical protein